MEIKEAMASKVNVPVIDWAIPPAFSLSWFGVRVNKVKCSEE